MEYFYRWLIVLTSFPIAEVAVSQTFEEMDPKHVIHRETMQEVYDEVKTPHPFGLIMIHEDTSNMIDCPTVFRKDSTWYMTYLVFNGKGYETWLAKSNDLLKWEKLGKVLPFTSKNRWDGNQAAGYPALIDTKWGGSYEIQKYLNHYWMSYFGGNTDGYERGTLSIGMAFTDKDVTTPHPWLRAKNPVMTTNDPDIGYWETKKLYKSSIIWDTTLQTGKPFVMFYNGVGDTSSKKSWVERIGIAVSDDMINWYRYPGNPIIDHGTGLSGDAVVQRWRDSLYIMFYYGAFWPEGREDAFNRFAVSKDLIHWTPWQGDDLIKPSQPYDIKYAHKPCVIKWNGVVYHFYCAVNELEQRGLAVSTSIDLGKSDLHFQKVTTKLKR